MRRPRGALARTVGAVAQSIADAARRRQAEREPRVVIYDAAGHATLLRPDAPEQERVAAVAEDLIVAAHSGTDLDAPDSPE